MFSLRLLSLPAGIRWRSALFCLTALLLSLVLSLVPSRAHEGHDHDDSGRAAITAVAFPRTTSSSELYEAVGILRGDRLTFYIDRFATNEPVVGATVSVTVGDGAAVTAEATPEGTYSVPFKRALADSVDVVLNVAAPDGDDLLVGTMSQTGAASAAAGTAADWTAFLPSLLRSPGLLALAVFGLGAAFVFLRWKNRPLPAMATGGAALAMLVLLVVVAFSAGSTPSGTVAPAALSDVPRRLPDGTAFVAKPTQRLLDIRTAAATSEGAVPGVRLIGRVIGDPDRTSVVQSVYGGRVTALASGFPRIGQKVRKGEPLVQITPHLPAADRTTISEKLGEIDQLIAVAEGRIRRLRPLAERGAAPLSQVTDAENELEGLKARRDTVRTLRGETEVLTAPTDGVIAVAKAVQGQVVQGQDLLFQIVDPQALWIEALVYGGLDPATLGEASAAGADGSSLALEHRGFSRALQQHAAVVHYAIVDPPPNLSIGQPVTVSAGKGDAVTGLVVARDAVVRSPAGEAIVWLHADAERFEARPVRTQMLDATRLIVAAGLKEGERVVVRGADLINQVR
jgi:cobalt-zinc-cadmium efflux system membrane fusion protein